MTRSSSHVAVRSLGLWLLMATDPGDSASAFYIDAWRWRVTLRGSFGEWLGIVRLLIWFCLARAGRMALWTLWRWRQSLDASPHCHSLDRGQCRTDQLHLDRWPRPRPAVGIASDSPVLAAFALPTLKTHRQRCRGLVLGVLLQRSRTGLYGWSMPPCSWAGLPTPDGQYRSPGPGF